jgi:hypothetical protein
MGNPKSKKKTKSEKSKPNKNPINPNPIKIQKSNLNQKKIR